jgi:hypothetical protein
MRAIQRDGDLITGMISVPLQSGESDIESMIKKPLANSYVFCLVRLALTSVFPSQHSVKPDRPFNP